VPLEAMMALPLVTFNAPATVAPMPGAVSLSGTMAMGPPGATGTPGVAKSVFAGGVDAGLEAEAVCAGAGNVINSAAARA
ncbi:MAG TPA: hypothetical protein VFJ52_11690, partial [Terriglobia bacterium]|nr:hypothetical protein [Terriglobia bacterium]